MSTRNTKTKSIILDSLKKSRQALSHENLLNTLGGQADRATIYRVLNRFCDEGIAHRIVGDDGKQYFAICINCEKKNHHHNHFHFRCLGCDKVECMPNEANLNLPVGYSVSNFNGFISGYCPDCS
ncbi:Fur family transcriptional regulator [Flavobacterium lindanitolerans]|uniref:Fur family transcriptional regulator n=1 Tax=Flavobacterium lindanitolerans TaxID=428988 RepID=UPI0027B92DD1|nr:transcriptional repressor [Flavobacterium lindanitolerans]